VITTDRSVCGNMLRNTPNRRKSTAYQFSC